jgi:diguanylate cyclase (GGDEF)-like protein
VSQTKCSLLVVDDEPYILGMLATLLSADFEVYTADGGEAAKALFHQRDIDLILTDHNMPGMTGVALLEWVRQHSPNTIRLLMTGFAELEQAVDAINRGQVFRYLFKPIEADVLLENLKGAARTFLIERSHERLLEELRQLNLVLEQRVQERTQQLEEANQELEQKNKMLERLALTDPLTTLPNRRAIDRLAEAELRRLKRYPGAVTIGLIDVDHFKEINCRYLLPGGDKVLADLAKVLKGSLRDVDQLGRIGGEEFLVVAPETGPEGAEALGERIRSTVQSAVFSYKDELIQVTVSIGFAIAVDGRVAEYEHLKHIAASALSEAKETGRNRCVFRTLSELPVEQAG